jgi:ubiquinone/menaquinone biosynthesis C-methylase UbiE
LSEDFILKFWQSQASEFGGSHWASWGDHWMIDLEIGTIGEHIFEGAKVLDAGCSNGYAAFRQLASRRPSSIVGIDYSSNMIAAAKAALAKEKPAGSISFKVGDVRALDFADDEFDIVYTTRVLINLPTWEEQRGAIDECLRVAKPGGKVVLSEAFWEPLVLLNAMRQLVQLAPLVEHDFNRYLKMRKVKEHLLSRQLDFQLDDFSSVYYLGSRFVRELVTDPSAYPGYDNPINKIFFEIERQYSGGGFGVQQAVIITKPAR